jgi:hypothetical protein
MQKARRIDHIVSLVYGHDAADKQYCRLGTTLFRLEDTRAKFLAFLARREGMYRSTHKAGLFLRERLEPWNFIPGDSGTAIYGDVPYDEMLRIAVKRNMDPFLIWLWHQGVQPSECFWEYDVPMTEEEAHNALFDAELDQYAAWALQRFEGDSELEAAYDHFASAYGCALIAYSNAIEGFITWAQEGSDDPYLEEVEWTEQLSDVLGTYCE